MKPIYMSFFLKFILPLFIVCGCIEDATYKHKNTWIPEQLKDGWGISTPAKEGISEDSLQLIYSKLTDENNYYNTLGFVVIKNNQLVYETYIRTPKDRDRIHHIQSCTKSFTSMAFGIAFSNGYIDSLDQTFCSIYPEKCPNDSIKQAITLRHLLTMRSGLSVDNSIYSLEMYVDKPSDPIGHILSKQLYARPGDSMYYRDADPQLISYAIQKLSGQTEEQLLKTHLFEPLGIRNYYWEPMPDGSTSGPHSLYLKPRDMARIGQLLLNQGKWEGQQLLDSSWIAESTSPHVQNEWQNIVWDYGYYWWVLSEYEAYTAVGHGGQYIMVVPHQNMVLVMISMPDTNDDYVGTTLKDFLQLVKPILTKTH